MKKYFTIGALFIIASSINAQKILTGDQAQKEIPGATLIRYVENRDFPDYIRLDESIRISYENGISWLQTSVELPNTESLVLANVEKDNIGMDHYSYQHYYNGIPVQYSEYKFHGKQGNIISYNGSLFTKIETSTTPFINSATSIELAKNYIGAATYKWELPGEEKFIKWRKSDQNATYFPQPELCIIPKNGNFKHPEFRLAWKMEIYAHAPMSKHIVYVDALTGEIIWTENQIHHLDTPGTAVTAYSGSQTIITDSFGAGYRLRESGRGNGIETYDLNNTTDYGSAVDFTDTDNNWVGMIPAFDQYALDAHFGAEMTYDYFLNVHGRNSIDGAGFPLISYVHYDVGYDNAFWNGSEMTYGDAGGPPNSPLTTLEITGHEITHGLTGLSAGLIYQDESGGLNESFSDIFGVSIKSFAVGYTGDSLWTIAKQCYPPNGFRLMSNPSAFGDPDTYEGTGWIPAGGPDNGGVHTNSGVQNYWYFIMCEGDSGVNDNADVYNVPGMGMGDASKIAFRNLTIYLNPSSDFSDARFYSIVSAQDLFGDCSAHVKTTTNAWHAVGVGDPYHDGVTVNFSSTINTVCTLPANISFINSTLTGNPLTTYLWDFGDGSQSTQANPNHSYANNGIYSVTLMADADGCGTDTLIQTNMINIGIPPPPTISNYCTTTNPVIADLNATASGSVYWYNTPGTPNEFHIGNSFTTPSLSSVTIYYVENHVPNAPQNVPPFTNVFGTGSYFDSPYSEYLEFTVHQPITLNSVRVYAGSAGNKTIELWSGTGTPITNLVANVPTGESVVNLGWELNPGNYRIGGTHMDLYKNGTGVNFPYSLPSLVTITGSSDGPNRYFYFYDWNISSSCISNRIPVYVNMFAPTADFTWNQLDQTVTFTNTSTNGVNYYWDFGGGSTSTATNPIHDYVWGGTHLATLVAENQGCFDTTWTSLDIIGIEEQNGISGSIYPVPFRDMLNINIDITVTNEELNISAYNMLGAKVSEIYNGIVSNPDFHYVWNSPVNMAPGTYVIKINYGGKELVKRVIKL